MLTNVIGIIKQNTNTALSFIKYQRQTIIRANEACTLFCIASIVIMWRLLTCENKTVNWYLDSSTFHCSGVIMGAIASQITSLTIVYSTVYSGADQRKHQSSASLAFVRGIHRFPAERASNAENVSIWWRHHISDEHVAVMDVVYFAAESPCIVTFSHMHSRWLRTVVQFIQIYQHQFSHGTQGFHMVTVSYLVQRHQLAFSQGPCPKPFKQW